jgi:hypothetical protein
VIFPEVNGIDQLQLFLLQILYLLQDHGFAVLFLRKLQFQTLYFLPIFL